MVKRVRSETHIPLQYNANGGNLQGNLRTFELEFGLKVKMEEVIFKFD